MMKTETPSTGKSERLVSLDVLRGLDLFFLLCLGPVLRALFTGPYKEAVAQSEFWQGVSRQLQHVSWEGFVAWDLIMPLFLFMVGVAIPFSLGKYVSGQNERATGRLYLRIVRRVILLWIFGMIVQGNLLSLKLQGLQLYSNTLQAIAAGYLISCVVYLAFRMRGQIAVTVLLMLAYWSVMTFVKVGDCGGGSFEQNTNMAEWIDRAILGGWHAGARYAADGTWTYAASYHYTWILSSLTFAATVMTGVFAGELVRPRKRPVATVSDEQTPVPEASASGERHVFVASGKVFSCLLGLGILATLAGWFWAQVPRDCFGYCPMIKTIWTPSMVLFSSGLSYLLLALCYGVIDVLKLRWGTLFFVVIGMNAITAYTLGHVIKFPKIAEMVCYGLQQYLGAWYPIALQLAGFALLFYVLLAMYRAKRFVRL